MSNKQKQILEIIKQFVPKKFGIKQAYYRADLNKIELLFVVDQKNASSSINYLNSLSSILEEQNKDIQIETNVYIYEKNKDFKTVADDGRLEKMNLSNFAMAF